MSFGAMGRELTNWPRSEPNAGSPVWSPDGGIIRFYKDDKLWADVVERIESSSVAFRLAPFRPMLRPLDPRWKILPVPVRISGTGGTRFGLSMSGAGCFASHPRSRFN